MKKNILGIVVIGKNEEKVLEETFLSVKKSVKVFKKNFNEEVKLVYVDSDSEDNSLNIARKHNVEFIQLTGKCSPGIARNAGVELLDTEYVFFLDGDTQVDENWLVTALKYLKTNPCVVGVGGELIFNVIDKEGQVTWMNSNYWGVKREEENIYDGVGGTFIYKRKQFLLAGGFSDKYRIGEEFDLMLRVLALGYDVKRINTTMAIHKDYKTKKVSFVKRYLLTRNIFIPGMVIANSPLTRRTIKVVIMRYWLHFIQLPLLLSVLIYFDLNVTSVIFGVLFLFNLIYKKFDFKRAIISMVTMNFYSFGIYFGLLKRK